ncbi:MAG: hypothetical protein ACFCGT_07215 [Sandaracinaceae bacterium]
MAETKKKRARRSKKVSSNGPARASRRGSPEAIEKRRAARALNAIFAGRQEGPQGLDGRTEKRRQRLVAELKEGKSAKGEPLQPVEQLQHVDDLMEIGETVASLRKQGVKFPRTRVAELRGADDLIEQVQEAYDFRAEAWRILGVKR